MPKDGSRLEFGLLCVGILLIASFAVGAFGPADPDFDYAFGVEGYRYPGLVPFLAAAGLLLGLLLSSRVAGRVGSAVGRLRAAGPIGVPLLLVAFGAAFWLLANRRLSGDAGSVVFRMANREIYASNALTCYLFRLLERLLGLGVVDTIRLASCLAGVVYAACCVGIGRTCAPAGPRRAGITALLLTTGTVALFFGTVEVYGPLVAALAAYLLFGIRWLGGKGRGIAPPLALGIAMAFHMSAGLLLPSLGLLANRGRFHPIRFRRWVLWGIVCLIPLALVVGLLYFDQWGGDLPEPGTKMYGTLFGPGEDGPVLPLTHSPYAPRQLYAVLDTEHALGVLNLLLLLAPVGLALIFVGRRQWKDPMFRFAAAVALFLVLYPNFWQISYPLRRDWDLFSLLGVPVALLGALAYFGSERRVESTVRVAALSLFCTVPFVLSNALVPRETADYAAVAASRLQIAARIAAAREIAELVEDRAEEAGLEAPGGHPSAFREQVEWIAGQTIQSTGSLLRTVPRLEEGRFRAAVEKVLIRSGVESGRSLDAGAVAPVLARELKAELERVRNGGWRMPGLGVLAAAVANRAMSARDLEEVRAAHRANPIGLHLVVLDALDEAMATESGSTLVRPAPDPAAWRSMLERDFRQLKRNQRLALDASRWARLAADAMEEVLDEPKARELDRRWVSLTDEAARWDLIVRGSPYPGFEAAVARATWFTGLQDMPQRQRIGIAEEMVRHILERVPDSPDCIGLLARLAAESGRSGEAVELYRRQILANPNSLPPRLALAELLLSDGRREEAVGVLERGVRIDAWHPSCPWALAQLAELRLDGGEARVAGSNLREVLRLLERTEPSADRERLANRVQGLLIRCGL